MQNNSRPGMTNFSLDFVKKVKTVRQSNSAKRWAALLSLIALVQPPVIQAATTELAQKYPTKPIRFVIGYAPGGPSDISARVLGQKLTERLGKQVLVDNRDGASGVIAAAIVSKAAPDGYTLLMGNISILATNVSMHADLPYHPLKNFSPVTLVESTPYMVMVNPKLPVKTLSEFIALAKAKPGQLNYGSSGTGGGVHLATEMFKWMTGINIVHVMYKGGSLVLSDLMAGQIHLLFSQPVVAIPAVRSEKVKVLATTGIRRSSAFPEYPTVAESGVPGYEAVTWKGVVVPFGTPKAIVGKLQIEIASSLRAPDMAQRFAREGAEPGGNSPSEFYVYIKNEIEKWAKVVKESGANAQGS